MLCLIITLAFLGQVLCQQVCDDVVPCPAGSSCHPNQGICYQDPQTAVRPHVWLGTAPRCNRKFSDCEYFDMEYDTSHVRGDSDSGWCNSGIKIRCIVKEAPQKSPPTPANQLQVVAYNIFERIWFASIDGQRERSCRIPAFFEEFHPDIDVFVFQEAFMGGCFSQIVVDGGGQLDLRDLLAYHGFPYSTRTVDAPLKPENGGIFIASRWPILEEDQIVFKTSEEGSWDVLAAKGVSYAKIEKTVDGESRIYHVSGSHFQAGGSAEVKYGQAQEWADFMKTKDLHSEEPVIFAGDFNVNYWGTDERWDNVLGILGAAQPVLTGPVNASANPTVNDLLQLKGRTDWGSWIDHVLYSMDHLKPESYTTEILIAKFPEPMAVCWCEECINPTRFNYVWPERSLSCPRVEYVRSLSDHQPVLGRFTFK